MANPQYDEYVEIDAKNIRETDDAVNFFDGDDYFWIPKSVMEDWPSLGEEGTAIVAYWFAHREGLI